MIFLLMDFLLSFFNSSPTFLVLMSFLVYPKKNFFAFLFIPLTLDLLILNTYFLNTILFTIIFFLIKHLPITKISFFTYFFLISLIYFLYVFSLGIIQGYHFSYLIFFSLSNYILNLVIYIICYKILLPYIKLSR